MAKTVDLRTYIALERAFVRRLQRSWRIQSAPIYAKIAQACNDHQWDRARYYVTDLDMTEVGTHNREWIQYMLLSCAVFGANMVAKGKPSFVGVGTFDTFLKQVTNNFLMYLENAGTRRVQEEALQSIAEDEAQTKALKYDPAQPRDEDGKWIRTGLYRAIQDYVEGATYLNDTLRTIAKRHRDQGEVWDQGVEIDSLLGDKVAILDAHMKENPLPEDTILARSVPNYVVGGLEVGDTYQDDGYVSTTRNANRIPLIRKDIGAYREENHSILTIQAPKGLGHIDINKEFGRHEYDHQEEVVLPRGLRYQVVSKGPGNALTVKVLQ